MSTNNVTNGEGIKVGDKMKLTIDSSYVIYEAVEVGNYVVKLKRRTDNSTNYIYSIHFKKSEYFKIQGKKNLKKNNH